ncbi:MAG: Txe/YoeB family addiction module toxin [Planctomycetia bacterium]|nr:Txe/YoeB family addiction module toxin [Planctomycetia bacterium]
MLNRTVWKQRVHWIVRDLTLPWNRQILRTPFEGIGKPEPLKGDLSGYWSRRINDEHRLIYTVRNDDVIAIACRYHYGS